MADRTFYPAQSFGISRVYLEFQYTAPGASTSATVSAGSPQGAIASIAHVGGTNICTVTLADKFNAVVAHSVDVRDDTPNGAYASLGTVSNEGSSSAAISFKVAYWTAGGSASNDSTLVTCVQLALRNTAGAA